MQRIFKSISYIFHPVFIPLLGVVFYFSKTPRAIPEEIIWAKLISLSILTIILPILLYFLLRSVGKANSIFLSTAKERIIPLFLNCVIVLLIIFRVLPAYEYIELYSFFVGILMSTFTCMILAIAKFKASIHLMALGGLFMFCIALSIHFSKNFNGTIALLCIITGAVTTSRLLLNAHTYRELTVGFFIGMIPQLLMVNYWL